MARIDNNGRRIGVTPVPGTSTGPNMPQGQFGTGTGTYVRNGVNPVTALPNGLDSNYVFASGIHEPQISNLLSIKYPQYALTSLLEQLGRSVPSTAEDFNWYEMDRTRRGGVVSSFTGTIPGLTVTVVTNIAITNPYFIPNDVIRLPSGINARVTAIGAGGASNAFQTLTLVREDGQNFTATSIANNDAFGHAYSAFGEGSTSAGYGRGYLPEERFNKLSIIRRTQKVTGTELTNKTRIGNGEAWYWTCQEIEMKEFARDRELAILLSQMSPDGSAIQTGEGVLTTIQNQGTLTTFSGRLTEAVLQEHILNMSYNFGYGSTTYVALCGQDFLADVYDVLKKYQIGNVNGNTANQGGVSYGQFGSVKVVGLDLMDYRFFGKTLRFVHYPMFDDPAIFPYRGTLSGGLSTGVDANRFSYSSAAMFLDMGTDSSGNKLVTLRHKELNGESRSSIVKTIAGMMSGGSTGMAANSFDGFQVEYLSHIGIEVRIPQRHGFMIRVGA